MRIRLFVQIFKGSTKTSRVLWFQYPNSFLQKSKQTRLLFIQAVLIILITYQLHKVTCLSQRGYFTFFTFFNEYGYSLMINNDKNLMILCWITLLPLPPKEQLYHIENMES
jgi:hypothetical protein